MTRWWSLLALSLLLAGCSDSGKDPVANAPGVEVPDDIEVTKELGAIAGVVIDASVRPIAGISVQLVGATPGNATSGEDGSFRFEALEPGPYAMLVEDPLYNATQVALEVVANEVATARIRLDRNLVSAPYHHTLVFDGRSDPWLGFPSFAAEVLAPGSLGCTCALNVTPGPGIVGFTYEAVGESDIDYSAVPVYGNLYWEFVGEPLQDGQDIRSGHGSFPVYQTFERSSFGNSTDDWLARITPGNYPHMSFEYTMYITLWYHEAAPEGWSFVAGDT